MKIAVVGATGLVGREMMKVLEERKVNPTLFIPVASPASTGKTVTFAGQQYQILGNSEALELEPDIALFSAGGSTSLEWAKQYAEKGTFVIDNSSAWRMESWVPLVVPEINATELTSDTKIIANPNCSTIELVMVLAPLNIRYKIKRVIVSTYQSVTGSGNKAVRQLEDERRGISGEKAYPHTIDLNLFPHAGVFTGNGYTSEEIKLVNETRKILNDYSIELTATVVRVPVMGGHSESVNIEFANDFDIDDVKKMLSETPGVVLKDDPASNVYPMPLYAWGKDEVFVGRIRRDLSRPNSLNLFIVSDNLRKGAATNAVQIAQYLIDNHLVS